MEWVLLLAAAALAAAAVGGAHVVRTRRRAAVDAEDPGRGTAAELARRAVEEDAEASKQVADDLWLRNTRPRF